MALNPVLYKKVSFTKERFFQSFLHLTANQDQHVLLESGRTGRYSIAGIKPFAVIQGNEQEVEIDERGEKTVLTGKPLAVLEKWMNQFAFSPIAELPDFQGGAIGYISYDYGQCIEKLPDIAEDDLQLPLLHFLVFDEWAVFDHEGECLWVMVLNRGAAQEKLESLTNAWLTEPDENENQNLVPLSEQK